MATCPPNSRCQQLQQRICTEQLCDYRFPRKNVDFVRCRPSSITQPFPSWTQSMCQSLAQETKTCYHLFSFGFLHESGLGPLAFFLLRFRIPALGRRSASFFIEDKMVSWFSDKDNFPWNGVQNTLKICETTFGPRATFSPRGISKRLLELVRRYCIAYAPLELQIPECSAGVWMRQSVQDPVVFVTSHWTHVVVRVFS